MVRLGVIGYGYWGLNLVRNFGELTGCQVSRVCDSRPERLELARRRLPAASMTLDHQELLAASDIDAIVITTPVGSHFRLAWDALQAGKDVLVEKPLASTSDQAKRLIDEADRRGLVLMVDHTFAYAGAVWKIRDLIAGGDIGEIYYYDSVRVNLGPFQRDVNVLWNLAVHDLAIIDFVLPVQPTGVSATGLAHLSGEPENVAYVTLFFEGHLMAHVHVNWLAPVKVHRTLIGGSRRMIVYDDLEASDKVKIYDTGVSVNPSPESVYAMLVDYRTGDMWAPHLSRTEALRVEAAHFVECVEQRARPITDGAAGLRIVRILEAAAESMAEQGRPVQLEAAVGG